MCKKRRNPQKMKINHLDLFSGIGGFSLGLKKAGIKTDWIGYSDIDKYANEVFKRRFPNAKELGSITDIQPKDLPEIDLITFGFPCQDLSIAGKRGGLKANRSSLFFEAIKIIQHKKPKYFIFENVKGIFSSNEGKDFDIVLRSIADIGYDGQWELCNTRWYLPQNRERIYFVGHIRGEPRPKVFPLSKDDGEAKNDGGGKRIQIIDKQGNIKNNQAYAACLSGGGNSGGNHSDMDLIQVADYRNDEGLRIRKDGVSPCLATRKHSETDISTMPPIIKVHCTQQRGADRPSLTKECDCGSGKLKKNCCGVSGGSGHLAKKDGTVYCLDTGNTQAVEILDYRNDEGVRVRKDNNSPTLKAGMGAGGGNIPMVKPILTPNREKKRQNGRRFKEDGEVMFTLTSQDQHGVQINTNIRRLTPNECSRLQGFSCKNEDGVWDDSWNDIGISDTQRYKQFGNAVSVPVVKAIMEKLYKGEYNAEQK